MWPGKGIRGPQILPMLVFHFFDVPNDMQGS